MKDSSEKYLKKIAKNAGFVGFGNLLSLVFTPVIGILTTRSLGAELYGVYNLVLYWTNLIADICKVGSGAATIRFTALYKGEKSPEKIAGTIHYGLSIAFIGGGVSTILLLLFADLFNRLVIKQPSGSNALRFFSLNIILTAIYGVFIASLTGLQHQKYIIITTAIIAPIVKIISLVTLLSLGFGLYAALGSSLLQFFIIMILSCFFLIKIFPATRNFDFKRKAINTKEFWKYSFSVFATSLFNKYTFRLDLLFLGIFCTIKEVGIYSVALKILPLVSMPHYAIMSIFGPIVAELYAKREIKEIESLYKTVTRWSSAFSLLIYTTIVVFHNELLAIFGKEFTAASIALIILGLGDSFADLFGMSGQIINMIGKPIINLINSIITTIITVSLYLLLIPKYGTYGAAISYTIGIFLINIIRLLQVYKLLNIQPVKISLIKNFLSIIAASIIILLARSIRFIQSLSYEWIISMILFWILYFGFILILKTNDEDKIILNSIKMRLLRR